MAEQDEYIPITVKVFSEKWKHLLKLKYIEYSVDRTGWGQLRILLRSKDERIGCINYKDPETIEFIEDIEELVRTKQINQMHPFKQWS